MRREGASRRGGYAFHIEPGGHSAIYGGFFNPNKEDLLLLRRQIAADATPLRSVLESASHQRFFGALKGDRVKTAPKGFDRDHPDIDLIRHKQFYVEHTYTDSEVLSRGFEATMAADFAKMIPYFDAMTLFLTTDLNGESML